MNTGPSKMGAKKGAKKDAKSGTALCPICRKPTLRAHRPFCSKRCADIDLGRWLKGGYALPSAPIDESAEAMQEAMIEATDETLSELWNMSPNPATLEEDRD